MHRRLPLVLILLGGLVALAPLAHASPPDQIWIGGLYDGDDADDVVLAAISTDSVLGSPLLADLKTLLVLVGFIRLADAAGVRLAALSTFHIRAPPIP